MRKFGTVNQLKTNFDDYNYFINGVAGIGKTTLAYQLGKKIANSDEGTLIITCGREPLPTHIQGAFYAHAKTFKDFINIAKDLISNKADYPYTKYVAIDSSDEFVRICEDYVIDEWNATCKIEERAKSISQAYKGFQKGENRVCSLMINWLGQLEDAGYKRILIGHTKQKMSEDIYSGLSFEQITCNLDNKYYNALKDKVNLVATCYNEKEIVDIEEKKNAFNKKTMKVGNLISQHRVIVFRDDDSAIDTKTHFKHIVSKIDFSVEGFIQAVEDALKAERDEGGVPVAETPTKSPATPSTTTPQPTPEPTDDLNIDEPETDDTTSKEQLMDDIRAKFKTADKDTKAAVKKILTEKGSGKLDNSLDMDTLNEIYNLL